MLFSQGCAAVGTMGTGYAPKAANLMASQMDAQVMQKGNAGKGSANMQELPARQLELRNSITIMATVPVNINNLEVSNALARQMSEEISRWFVSAGYRVQEIRKGKEIVFQKKQGEMLLTRDTKQLAQRHVSSVAVLAGTYVVTPKQVRFTMRLLHTPSNEVIAMSTATVPITPDVRPLLKESTQPVKVTPSVQTRLQ